MLDILPLLEIGVAKKTYGFGIEIGEVGNCSGCISVFQAKILDHALYNLAPNRRLHKVF
jgi:hypothetical protein